MNNIFDKNIGLLSYEMQYRLNNSLVVLFGLGGVGGFAFESLLRAGINNFIIVDKDKFETSNLNRQLASNLDTLGLYKANVYKDKALKINKDINIIDLVNNVNSNNLNEIFNNIHSFKEVKNIYVADCIDDVNAKIEIMRYCSINNLKLISCMGTANHIKSDNIKISNLKHTKYCPLAKRIRVSLKNDENINPDVLYIEEEPVDISKNVDNNIHKSTIQYIPAICGMKIAEFIIKSIIYQ